MGNACSCTVPGAAAFTQVKLAPEVQKRLIKYCSTNNCAQSTVLARALQRFVDAPPPAEVLPTIAELLGLPGTATVAEIVSALQSLDAPPKDPLGDAPPDPEARRRTVARPSEAKRRALAKGMSEAEFDAKRAALLRSMRRGAR